MSTTRKLFLVVLVASVMWLMAGEANALSFNTAGNLPDLNGNGSSNDENKVAEAAVRIWAHAIKSKRSFTLTIQALDLGGNGAGAITDFDALGRPTAGTVWIDTNLSEGRWFVDPTPFRNEEFTVDPFNPNHFLLGPIGQIDLLTVMLHEIGHAIGWHSDGNPDFNPEYVELMNPQPRNFVEGERVWLRARGYNVPLHGDGVGSEIELVTGLSHTARLDSGVPRWNGSLMVPNAGQMGERYLPGLQEVKMFHAAYEDEIRRKIFRPRRALKPIVCDKD